MIGDYARKISEGQIPCHGKSGNRCEAPASGKK
jgi:hypothetical protein